VPHFLGCAASSCVRGTRAFSLHLATFFVFAFFIFLASSIIIIIIS